jgi:protein ImuB
MWSIDLLHRRMRDRATGDSASRSRRDVALLLTAQISNRHTVVDCCRRTRVKGVRPGMSVSHARALLPLDGVRLEDHDPERDQRALKALAAWATRFCPMVQPDEPDGLLMDVTGCARLYKCEHRLAMQVLKACAQIGITARVAIASTFACAWALARYSEHECVIAPPGAQRRAMADLPLAALRIDDDAVHALRTLGFTRVGQLYDVPRSTLPSRFGDAFLLRLDQALGEAVETINPVYPKPPVRAQRIFDGPTPKFEAIELATEGLLEPFCRELRARGVGVRRIDVQLDRSDAGPWRFHVAMSRATRNARHIWSLLRPQLEKANLGFGVDAVTLTATQTGRLRHEQGSRFGDDAGKRARCAQEVGAMVDALSARLGPERVQRAELVESHTPERAARRLPLAGGSRLRGGQRAQPAPNVRPSMLFDRPQRAEVIAITPDGPPAWARWPGGEGALVSAIGPEVISTEWWLDAPAARAQMKRVEDEADHEDLLEPALGTREYFRAQSQDGRWLWLFRHRETGRWGLHGLWT